MTPGPGIEPGTHWWKASALTTAPPHIYIEKERKNIRYYKTSFVNRTRQLYVASELRKDSFVNVKVIFQNTRRIKSFFPYKDSLNQSQLFKVIYKLVAGTAMISFHSENKAKTQRPENRNMISLGCYC